MEERNSSYAVGVPLHAATATTYPVNVRVQAPPVARPTRLPSAASIRIPDGQPPSKQQTIFYPTSHEFGLNSLSLSSFNISGSEITGNWDVGFLAKNTGTLGFGYSYDHVILSVFYKNELLSEAPLPRIHLPMKTKSFTANTVALAKRIEDIQVADAITREWSELGVVAFTVRLLDTSYTSFNNKIYNLNVTCADIKVGFSNHSSSHGTMLVAQQQHSPHNTPDQQAFYSLFNIAACLVA